MICDICGHKALSSRNIQGLYYCSRCNCYGYVPKDALDGVEIPVLLKSLTEINPMSDLFTLSTIGLIGDICLTEPRLTHIISELISSDFPLKKLIEECKSDSDIDSVTEQICHRFLFNVLTCDYIVRAFAYALGKCKAYKGIHSISKTWNNNGVISFFEVSRKSVRPGESVNVYWRINSLQPSLHIEIDGAVIAESNLSEGVVNCVIDQDCVICITAFDRMTGAILAKKRATVSVSKTPIIKSFTSDSLNIIEGDSTLLSWDVTNFERLILLPDGLNVTNRSFIRVFPKKSKEYILIATNAVGEQVESRLVIDVCELPKIDLPNSLLVSNIHMPDFQKFLIPSLVSDMKRKDVYRLLGETGLSAKLFSLMSTFSYKIKAILYK